MAPRQQAASASTSFLNPDNATAGLRNQFNGTVTAAKYEPWDFKGKAKPSSKGNRHLSGVKFALHLTIDDVDDGDTKPEEVYWPGLPIEDCAPNDEGDGFTFIGGREGFPRNSELIQGVTAFIDCGAISKADISDNPEVFIGKRCFWERKAALWATQPREGSDAPSNLMPTKFIEDVTAGGKKGSGSSSSRAAAKGSSKSKREEPEEPEDNEVDSEIVDLAVELIIEALADRAADKKLEPADREVCSLEDLGSEVLGIMLSRKLDKATKAAVGKLFEDDEFVKEHASRKTWKYNAKDGEVTHIG